ncbi:MAG: 1-acyl-sn-glycerol-3-phosphate acyltransferase, partial [Actinomycetota bacterium]
RSITDEIMYELMLLTGQEYVDEYAAKVKDQIKKAAAENPAEPKPLQKAG